MSLPIISISTTQAVCESTNMTVCTRTLSILWGSFSLDIQLGRVW